jgi:CDP-glucose 4,6-dehydratase
MFDDIYLNKKVLVTGHTGFKGSWLAIWLKELGADVIGYSLDPPSLPNNFQATNLREKINHIHGDIRHLDHLLDVFHQYQPEIVFHLAAQSLVRLSYEEPKLTLDTNIGGTVNVLEAIRLTPSIKVVVNITSDKCYENKEWSLGYRENDHLGGHDPYSSSKACSELVFSSYSRSFFSKSFTRNRQIGAASVRAGNVIGGGDWGKDRLLPDCIRALNNNQSIGIRNPHGIRPWQHVLEPLSGYLWLGVLLWECPERYSGAWNFGPEFNSHLTVAEVVKKLIQYWGTGTWQNLPDPDALHEAKILKLCCDKAHSELKWYSILNIEECLQMTVDWYKEYYSESQTKNMYSYCVRQIHQYEGTAAIKRLVYAWLQNQKT